MSSQSPSAAAGTTPPGRLSPAGMGGGGGGSGRSTGSGGGYPPRLAGQIAAASAEGSSPGRLSPKGGGSGYESGPSSTGGIRRSLSGSEALGSKKGAPRGLGVEGAPLLDDRGRLGRGYGSAAAAASGS